MDEINRAVFLIQELTDATNLIRTGFRLLQEIDMVNDAYNIPQQLLASGFERIMKSYICLVYQAREGNYPDSRMLKELGHDLMKLKRKIAEKYYNTNGTVFLEAELDYLDKDESLERILTVLSEFGKRGRYYNFDVVTGSTPSGIDPTTEWQRIERELVDFKPYLSPERSQYQQKDYYPRVNSVIIGKLEHFFRSIASQFTCGNHGGQLRQMSPTISAFYNMEDCEFGTVDYRQSDAKTKDKWHKRSKEKVLSSEWPSEVVTKGNFVGEWPFRFEEVVVECREKMFCVVNINGYDFSLNGSAKSRFNYPDPHESGVAIIGKSVGPFIELAFSLSGKRD